MNSYLVIGLGRFGQSIAKELYEQGYEVMGIDTDEAVVQSAADYLTHVISADCTEEDVLRSIGARNFDTAVVSTGDIQDNIMITMMLKEIGVKCVIAKAATERHAKVLEKVGADRIVFPERDMGIRLAHLITHDKFFEYIEFSKDYGMAEILAPNEWINKKICDINIRHKYGVSIVAIRRDNKTNVTPTGEDQILEGDKVTIVGANDKINNLK